LKQEKLALYLHFPFCKSKCYYCDFNSYSQQEKLMTAYGEALLLEVERSLPDDREISSIYFGGGTPSYFPIEILSKVLTFIKSRAKLARTTEVTLEVNPGTVGSNELQGLYQAGFNRLSIGLQVVQDHLLKTIGRIHNFVEFLEVFQAARELGFENLGIDLIFGLPGQTLLEWQESVTQVVKLQPEHISAYGLQLENGTPLAEMVATKRATLPSEDEVVTMMQWVMDFLPEVGYTHYEISNYAKPGKEARHNLGYWQGVEYLGFGAGAVSTFAGERWQNPAIPVEYIQAVHEGIVSRLELEKIDTKIAAREALMLGLRLNKGLNLQEYQHKYQLDLVEKLEPELISLIGQKLLQLEANQLSLTQQGIFLSNQVIGRLLNGLQ